MGNPTKRSWTTTHALARWWWHQVTVWVGDVCTRTPSCSAPSSRHQPPPRTSWSRWSCLLLRWVGGFVTLCRAFAEVVDEKPPRVACCTFRGWKGRPGFLVAQISSSSVITSVQDSLIAVTWNSLPSIDFPLIFKMCLLCPYVHLHIDVSLTPFVPLPLCSSLGITFLSG